MTQVEVVSTALVLPQSGVLVDLTSEKEVTIALKDVQEIKSKLMEAERRLREALAERAAVLGTKTIYVDGVGKVEVRGGQRIEYPDPLQLEEDLREYGCPEETIREIVIETVSHKVDGARARRAAAANPDYAKVIEDAQRVVETTPSVSIS